jgi:hypothetical protein
MWLQTLFHTGCVKETMSFHLSQTRQQRFYTLSSLAMMTAAFLPIIKANTQVRNLGNVDTVDIIQLRLLGYPASGWRKGGDSASPALLHSFCSGS